MVMELFVFAHPSERRTHAIVPAFEHDLTATNTNVERAFRDAFGRVSKVTDAVEKEKPSIMVGHAFGKSEGWAPRFSEPKPGPRASRKAYEAVPIPAPSNPVSAEHLRLAP